MVAIDSSHDIPARARPIAGHPGQIVLTALAFSVVIAVTTQSYFAGGGNGWSMAGQMVSRFSLLLFVAAMSVEPIARLIPVRAIQALGSERDSLMLGFACAAAVSLICVAAPSQFAAEAMSLPTIAYCAFTGLILAVMLFACHPTTVRLMGPPASRALQRVSTSYFWLVFVVTGLEHIVGPHRPDQWFGFSLLLLTATLLLRFADSLVAHWRGAAKAA